MAVYNIQLPENVSKKSLEQVTAYLYRLNEQLTYMFNNMTPEENYSNEAYVKYIQEGEKVTSIEVSLGKVSASVQQNTKDISRLEITSENIKLEMVKKGEVVSAINLSEEAVGRCCNSQQLFQNLGKWQDADHRWRIYRDGESIKGPGFYH